MPRCASSAVLLSAATAVARAAAPPAVPPNCSARTPPPGAGRCAVPPRDPEFGPVCSPGTAGHGGGAEAPVNRCPVVNYTDGVFRCACCGAPLFAAASKFDAGTGWPAFHSPAVVGGDGESNVCTPVRYRTEPWEVVCSHCGAHLGDYFPFDNDHFCVDGVCLTPPGAAAGDTCSGCPGGSARACAGQCPLGDQYDDCVNGCAAHCAGGAPPPPHPARPAPRERLRRRAAAGHAQR